MIRSIHIEHLALVDEATLELGNGLTTITGETGAGKTLAIGAIGLVFGGPASPGQVAPGADHAYVEAGFEVGAGFWQQPDVAALAELRPEGEDALVLARKVFPDGRTRALAWGRSVSKADLVAAGSQLVAIASQHDQRRLVDAGYQRQLLDGCGDAAHAELVTAMRAAWDALTQARSEHQRIADEVATIAVRAEEIRDALSRIDTVDPSLEEEAHLQAQRDRVRHSAEIHAALANAVNALAADGSGGVDAAGRAYTALDGAATMDPELAHLAAQCLAAQEQLGEVSSELRMRMDELAESPASAESIEERLSAYDDLKRHFGGTVEAVCAERERLREQSELLTSGGDALDAAAAALTAAERAAQDVAGSLRADRMSLASTLADRVQSELADLGMADSVFVVEVEEAKLGAHGADRIVFRLAPSKRHTPGPIDKIASGGELSRIALALAVASGVAEAPTLVFDEVDAGIGGTTANAVAKKLHQLAATTQVLCITHLAQIAGQANSHVVVAKSDGATTLTRLRGEDEVVDELCRMVGAATDDPAARAHAQGLRRFTAAPSKLPSVDEPLSLDV
jgi:DNA repair protein RecN (Recombination protein N)